METHERLRGIGHLLRSDHAVGPEHRILGETADLDAELKGPVVYRFDRRRAVRPDLDVFGFIGKHEHCSQPGGAAFIGNSLFFGGLRGQALYEAVTGNNQVTEFKEHFKGKYGRIREVIAGPDGMLYITTSNRDGRGVPKPEDDRIIRINPTKL